ncbi:hypothetical protein ABH924_003333 [Arthrobacter sp. GAS37]|uniref:hypothetical protein n=1 Tax=Arthrobacter sp. GAS37 TaxID=3156261 RepID=UPI003836979F
MNTEDRQYRTLSVHRPWAWMMWSAEAPLITEDPDHTDHRSPREVTESIDWSRVYQAVHRAIHGIPVEAGTLYTPVIDVKVPVALTEAEFLLASSWVSHEMPVRYHYEDDLIFEGRHRLWASREHHGDRGVPVLSESLSYLGDVLHGRAGTDKETTTESIAAAASWWDHNPDRSNWGVTRPHQRMLALAHLELTAPQPVSPEWFDRLCKWDNRIEVLAGLHAAGRTDANLLSAELYWAWRYQQDRTSIAPELVISMFSCLGFRNNSKPAKPPSGTLTLYRGATEENRAGTAWTLNPAIAHHFAGTRQGNRRGQVWKVTVPSSRALAYLSDEQEFILDLAGLEHLIKKADPSSRPDRMTRWRTRHLRRIPLFGNHDLDV